MANSINTNYGASVALQNLNATNRALETTQGRINTGKAITSAKDNGAIWSIAQSQTVQMNSLDAVKQSLQRGQSTIDVAMSAGETVKDVLGQMKSLVLAASDPSADKASLDAYEEDFKNLAKQITTTIQGANFNGVNMIANLDANGVVVNKSDAATQTATGKSLKALASADGKNAIEVTGLNFGLYTADGRTGTVAGTATVAGAAGSATNAGASGVKVASDSFTAARTAAKVHSDAGLGTAANETARTAEWSNLMKQVDDSITYVTSSLTKLGTGSKALDNQLTFTSKLQDTLETGIGNLVDADLAKESAKLTALQTKQQLGVQALSIANSSSSVLLSLFR
ncbi:flagellin [Brevundimonas sp. PAMC22021]|uniref:flagellin n=1 Tax=Brevundimonas sp. PAMC22021 TaxID=2861285 RepID=UPI001C63213F|nr:flagellin [Brevundimonas sp. PAMC22021]QYF87523.1 flagellin [Brevundimonas sp. PAMC22021]